MWQRAIHEYLVKKVSFLPFDSIHFFFVLTITALGNALFPPVRAVHVCQAAWRGSAAAAARVSTKQAVGSS